MPEIPESRLWPDPRCSVTLTRNGPLDERDAELADLLAEVRRLRAVAVAAKDLRTAVVSLVERTGCEGDTPDGSCADYTPHDLCGMCGMQAPLDRLDGALRDAGIGGGT